jgi:tripartite-type tricarboxylate transporter receptor subunit TctC
MKLPHRRQFLHLAAGAAALPAVFATTDIVAAQDWPVRPVTLVVPYAAGGPLDGVARILTPRISEILGAQIIVENVGGAGGMNGVARVAKAAADGYQFVVGDNGTFAANRTLYKNPLYDPGRDFTPVALVGGQSMVLLARNDLPADDLQGFITYSKNSKTNQTKMQFGSAGVVPPHLACALLNTTVGVNVTHIPYRGSAPALQDLIAGRIDYQCVGTVASIPQIDSRTVKALALLTRSRSPSLPALASAEEQGLANFDADAWLAFFLPKGTPVSIVQKLHRATVTAMDTPAVQERLKALGVTVVPPQSRSPEYLQKFVAEETEKWAKVIRTANIKI